MEISKNRGYWTFCDELCFEFFQKYGRATSLFLDSQFLERSFLPYLIFTKQYANWNRFKNAVKHLTDLIGMYGWVLISKDWNKKHKHTGLIHPYNWKREKYLTYFKEFFPTIEESIADYWNFLANNIDSL